jgi:FkbM family methyltransferase
MRFVDFLEALVLPRLRLPIRYFYLLITRQLEPEIRFLRSTIDSGKRFVDVGANVGLYSFALCSKFQHVDAFEPLANASQPLIDYKKPNISVHAVALSNEAGQAELIIPKENDKPIQTRASLNHSTIQSAGLGMQPEVVQVELVRLDDFYFNDIDLLKIDVEGHELQVLHGARNTIERCRPLLVIEIEQRHLKTPIETVFNFLENLGYEGFYLKDGQVIPLVDFNVDLDQDLAKHTEHGAGYINNFIFRHL